MSSQFGQSHLAYFVRTAEEGQISRAAAALHIAQPALSSAILKLERRVGVELFVRHARGVSLTRAGEDFYEKARAAVHAEDDAVATALSLASSCRRTIEVGFLGALPQLVAPGVLERFAELCPDAGVTFRELRFPSGAMASWLSHVDVALCFSPVADADVRVQVIREEPRGVLLCERHPLAGRRELFLEDVLDEWFCGLHPSVDPRWAGFWSLDDHRGRPPPHVTRDAATRYVELFAALVAARSICILPIVVAESAAALRGPLVALPLRDAAPATCVLAWRASAENPLTAPFAETASNEPAASRAASERDAVAAMPASRVASGLAAA